MTNQRITIGSIVEIRLSNEYYCYAQILGKAAYAFFDYKSNEKLSDFTILKKLPVLFVLSVYNDAVTKGRWLKVGKMEISNYLKILPRQFIQDSIDNQKFELYDPNTGEITPTTKENAEGLECAAVWEAEHVESRIMDYYNGVPNDWVEQLKIK
jgi:hypothetical protein